MHIQLSSIFILLLAAVQGVFSRTAGCGKAPVSSGTKSITVNGSQRQYILQLPSNYDNNKAHMLIFGLHWLGGSMNDVAPNYYGLRQLAGNNAIFVAPNGLNNGWANDGGRDVAFIDAVIAQVQNDLCTDETQRFSTGFSFGGGMSYALACARPDVFRAVAPIAGAEISGCSGGNSPVAYLGIHGTNDNVLPISMGRSIRDRFLRNNGCQSQNAPEPGNGQGPIKTQYSCRDGFPVTWIAFSGGHDPNQSFVATELWQFFSQFGSGGGGNPPTIPPTPPTTPPPGTNCSPRWGQCGGQGWTGATCCSEGTCQQQNQWYSQCL